MKKYVTENTMVENKNSYLKTLEINMKRELIYK
jgi:hypothetical protein